MINRQRLVGEFLELVQTSSLSKREGQVAKRLTATLAGMGHRSEAVARSLAWLLRFLGETP